MDFKVRKISKEHKKYSQYFNKIKNYIIQKYMHNKKLAVYIVVFIVGIGLFQSLNTPQKITQFVVDKIAQNIQKNKLNYTNILITGVGGENHDGAYLTDSIMVASLNSKKKHVLLTSIPRDIFIESEAFSSQRINSVYANHQKLGHDIAMGHLTQSVSNLIGQEIHYNVMIDFNAVIDLINILDGIEIYNPETIYDPFYPTENFTFETFTLAPGYQTLDGDTALKFMRTRKTSSDFARSKRQQQVIIAAKEKASKLELFQSPSKIIDIFEAIKQNIQTNLSNTQILSLVQHFKDINYKKFTHLILNDNPTSQGSFIYSPPLSEYYDAYVLIPLDDSGNEIRTYIQLHQNYHKAMHFNGKLVVKNGTKTQNLASNVASILNRYGIEVTSIENADSKNYLKTVIKNYDLAGSNTLNAINQILPDTINKTIDNIDPDIPIYTEIILGQDIADIINEIDSYNQKIPIITKAQSEYEAFKNELTEPKTGSNPDSNLTNNVDADSTDPKQESEATTNTSSNPLTE